MTAKEKKVAKEEKRLQEIFKDIEPKRKAAAFELIHQAAYLSVTIRDLSQDLDENGIVEMFTQSEKTEPYERQRPTATVFCSMNTSYQKAIKQLTDLLPKETAKPKADDDGFDDFVTALDD